MEFKTNWHDSPMIKKFTFQNEKSLLETPIFSVKTKEYKKPDDKSNFTAYVIDSLDWVNIVAITPDQNTLLIKQFRYGTDTIEWEIPGGLIEPNETPLHAAQRELEEETGYQATIWTQIGVVNSNPAIQSNKCYTFLAIDAKPTGTTNFDPDEYIDPELTPSSQVHSMIKEGKITNPYIITAFFWYFLYNTEE